MENTANLKRKNGAVGNFKSGGGGGGIPLPNSKRFAMWEPAGVGAYVNESDTPQPFDPLSAWDFTNDKLTFCRGGTGLIATVPPSSSAGVSLQTQSSEIVDPVCFYGQPFIVPSRKVKLLGAVTFVDNLSADNNFVGLCSYSRGPTGDTFTHGIDPLSSYQTGPFSAIITTATPAPDALGLHLLRPTANDPLSTWKFASALLGVITEVDTGIPIVSGQRMKFEIVLQNGQASLILNGKPAGTITTNLPAAALALAYTAFTSDPAFIEPGLLGDFMQVEYLYAENDTV